ncbi:MAG: nucleotidyltransferase family protein [Victivallaceae bacterium]|nr:nucleotidyltransferase family protein [Victivallaceae bacterium]
MTGEKEKLLLTVMRNWIFGCGGTTFYSLDISEQSALCRLAEECGLQCFFIWYAIRDNRRLPPDFHDRFARFYQAAAARELPKQAALKKVYAILQDNHIDYIPLKGSFLAYHAYPAPALRPRSDIDLLLREADLERAADVFHRLGWTNHDERMYTLHIPALLSPDRRILFEPHFAIFRPSPGTAGNAQLWELAERKNDGEPFFLPPELLFLHALDGAINDNLAMGMKPLLDTAMLAARFKLSAEQVAAAAAKYCPAVRPRLLFAAFPELFGAEDNFSDIPPEVSEAFRSLPFAAWLMKADSYKMLLARDYATKSAAGKLAFFAGRLFAAPAELRKRYGLAKNTVWRLPFFYVIDLFRKIKVFILKNSDTTDDAITAAAQKQTLLREYLKK